MKKHASSASFASAPDASGARRRHGSGPRSAFTLIEVLVCMGIFAIGFAAVAMMLPTGLVMQREIVNRGVGDICGRNTLEIVKGKGIYSLSHSYFPSLWFFPSPMTAGLPASTLPDDWFFFVPDDAPYPHPPTTQGTQSAVMAPYMNPAADGTYINSTKAYKAAGWGNATHFSRGVIHSLKNRTNAFSVLDASYPTSRLDIAARTHYCNVLMTNMSTTPNSTSPGGYTYYRAQPDTDQWRLTAVTLQKSDSGEWPEQGEYDLTNPDGQTCYSVSSDPSTMAAASSATPVYLRSTTPVDFRSIGGDSALGGLPDPQGTLWPRFFPSKGSMGTVPKTGGDPANSNPWMRGGNGLCGSPGWVYNSSPNNCGWNGFSHMIYVNAPIREAVASAYSYPTATPPKYRYPVPGIFHVQAIVYDRDNDLFLLRYPLCFAQQLKDSPNIPTGKETADARVISYRTALGIGTNGSGWIDRRLKVGDKFLASRGGYPFQVKEVLDAATAAATVPGGPVDWSDGTYQIVRVSPSLRATGYTANQPNRDTDASAWNNPDPISLIVSAPPVSGGPSPWVSTVQLDDNGSVNAKTQQGAFIRPWNCLTN